MSTPTPLSTKLAEVALRINAITLKPSDPFTWASGYRMPIYNDNRMLLCTAEIRSLIAEGFLHLLSTHDLHPEVIAGTSTGGISFGTTLADQLQLPFIYVREKPKGHGMQKRVEGVLDEGQRVVVIEDLVSTGGSSLEALRGVREAGGEVDTVLSIFSYGFSEAAEKFTAAEARYLALFTVETLLQVAEEKGYITHEEAALLGSWRKEPFSWGEKHGFPRIVKE